MLKKQLLNEEKLQQPNTHNFIETLLLSFTALLLSFTTQPETTAAKYCTTSTSSSVNRHGTSHDNTVCH